MSSNSVAQERWQTGPSLAASIWRYKWWVLAAMILVGVAAYLLSSLQPATYETTARLFLTDPRQAGVFGQQSRVDPERYVPQQAERITSAPVLQRASELLGGEWSPRQIGNRVEAVGDIDLDLIEITASAGDPEQAAELANTIAAAYMEVARDAKLEAAQAAAEELAAAAEELDEQIEQIQSENVDSAAIASQLEVLIRQRVDITSRAQQQLVDARVFGSGVDQVEAAPVPQAPTSPSPRRDAMLAAVLAAALASAAAYWRAGHSTRVEGRNEPAVILGAPLLGVLPLYEDTRKASLDERIALDAEAQEAYEFLLSSVEYALSSIDGRSVLITSAEPGQGKTEVSLQLAVTASLQARRTLLIDGDLRVRSLTHLVGADGGPGLVDLAVTAPRQYRTYVQQRSILGGEGQLAVLPAGSTADEGAASLRRPGLGRGLQLMREELDLVLVDSAPLLATADTTALSTSVDAMLIVVRAGTPLKDLESLRERLSFIGCPVIGYVYITRDFSDVGYAYGYGSYRYRHPRGVKSEVVGFDARHGFREAPAASAAFSGRDRDPETPSDLGVPGRPPIAARDNAPVGGGPPPGDAVAAASRDDEGVRRSDDADPGRQERAEGHPPDTGPTRPEPRPEADAGSPGGSPPREHAPRP